MAKYSFEAVVFDLDGVITKTALVHGRAWKKMFDDYLKYREEKFGEPFKEFTHEGDYLPYVDGKPRYKGVNDFLTSRGISIPFGDPNDDVALETCCGLGNRKNIAFNEVLENEGVQTYESTVEFMHQLKAAGVKVGVASSSKNCELVLQKVGLLPMIETRVDGVVSAELGLNGKPEPDIFTVACDNLGVAYDKAVIVEDAVSGVQAGRAGNFGLVIGLAREENERELQINGADIVVTDFEELGIEGVEAWFQSGVKTDKWQISYYDYDPKKEKSRESLLSVGNGYLGVRGAMEEVHAGETNYPATYIASLYNRLKSPIGDRMIENEDFVNTPNWTYTTFKINDGAWFDIQKANFVEYQRTIQLKNGISVRTIVVKDDAGRETKIVSKRTASMANPHIVALQYSVTPLNYAGKITFRGGIDGNIINDGVKRYSSLNQQHLTGVTQGAEGRLSYVVAKTTQSDIEIATVVKNKLFLNGEKQEVALAPTFNKNAVCVDGTLEVKKGETASYEKLGAIYTSLHYDSKTPFEDAKRDASVLCCFDKIVEESTTKWEELWKQIDVEVTGDRLAQKMLRLHLYHLMVSASIHNKNIDAHVTARGLHGEAYRGHIFWDELFILPAYNIHIPETAKSLMMYRYRRLQKSREYAAEYGYKGAMYAWQSGSDGREETQIVHLNPLTGEWGDDYSCLQRHVSLAVAYDVWQYYNTCNDKEFLSQYGAEMFLEIARFWASKTTFDATTGRYSIDKVMGPDEFHEAYPHATEGGLKDNAYTNVMCAWLFNKAEEVLALIDNADELKRKINLTAEEITTWKQIAKKLRVVINEEGIISQYDGYFDLHELDWDAYRAKYGNIYRMDRILKSEGKSADDYKVAKQADTLMLFYNLSAEEVNGIFTDLGYSLPADYIKKNLAYYLARTSHGSTLSRVVHTQLATMVNDKELSWKLYMGALTSDYGDVQGGTTGEGIHSGVMAATVMLALTNFAGVDIRSNVLKVNPNLPFHWTNMKFNLKFKGVDFNFELSKTEIKVQAIGNQPNVTIFIQDKKIEITTGHWEILPLK